MKTFKTLLLLAVTTIFITACGKEDTPPEPTVVADGTYIGTMTVYNEEGDSKHYEQKDVSIIIEKGEGDLINIKMQQVQFDERMPIKLNITIPDVSTVTEETGFSFSGDNILPLIGEDGSSDQFKMDDLEGSTTQDSTTFSVMCDIQVGPIDGTYLLSFTGTKVTK